MSGDPTTGIRAYFNADGSPRAWTQCEHRWTFFFGPAMRCTKCGAGTICNTGDRKEQPIDPPHQVLREIAGLAD